MSSLKIQYKLYTTHHLGLSVDRKHETRRGKRRGVDTKDRKKEHTEEQEQDLLERIAAEKTPFMQLNERNKISDELV